MIEYSIVIPAYNESDKITASLTHVVSYLRTLSDAFEVLVVNDGSKDNTSDVVKKYIKDNPEVKLIDNPHKGKGPTVWKGIMSAQGKYVYLSDADMSTPITELKKLLVWMIEQDFDVVIASREGSGAQRVNEPAYRHIMGRIFNFVVQAVALPGIRDSQCGFKLFKNDVAKDIFSKLQVYSDAAPITTTAFMGAFDVEVLFIAKKLGYKIKEVPVLWTYVKTSRLSPIKDSIRMTLDVIKVRLNDFRGMYK